MSRHVYIALAIAVTIAIIVALVPRSAWGVDVIRGQLIYETRCGACHDKSVHQRVSRKAGDFAGLRAQVLRWSREIGGAWSEQEINEVSVYLNNRYYFFRCPDAACGSTQTLREQK